MHELMYLTVMNAMYEERLREAERQRRGREAKQAARRPAAEGRQRHLLLTALLQRRPREA